MKGLLETFSDFVLKDRSKTAFSFLDDGANVKASLSYGDIDSRSRGVASHLLKNGVNPGDRVVLVYPPSLDYIVAFLGCLMAGVIAVPVFPPDPSDLNKHVSMFCVIVNSCEAKVALTSSAYNYATKLAGIRSFVNSNKSSTSWPELDWIVTDSIGGDPNFKYEGVSEDKIAFLQYTSGSTSEPKGVMISHGNLAHNLTCIIKGLSADETTVVVSWLPQYHDMGLIGSYLGILYCGGSGFYLSPISFVKKPSLWILAMSRYHATHMQAPNFAYGLTARKFSKQTNSEKIDLSHSRHMINAAEPVDLENTRAFYEAFGPLGLKHDVIFPTYGLAEHTVYVCSNGKQVLHVDKYELEVNRTVEVKLQASDNTSSLVGCGIPNELPDLKLIIVDPESRELLKEGKVGEIWVRSGSKAKGYWGLPEKSEETFQARHAGQEQQDSEGYLRTGDLGFLYHREVFICGRNKDLIIVRGRNHFPQDIEGTVEGTGAPNGAQAFRKGCSAAFSMQYANTEVLICAAEVTLEVAKSFSEHTGNSIIDAVKSEVSTLHGVAPNVVILLEPKSIPKTTSGKIARQWVKNAYLKDTLSVLQQSSNLSLLSEDSSSSSSSISNKAESEVRTVSQADMESKAAIDPTGVALASILDIMIEVVADVLQVNTAQIDGNVPLQHLGIDSLLGVQLIADLEQRFTVPIPEKLFMDADTSLATVAASLQNGGVIKPRPMLLKGWSVASHIGFQRALRLDEWDSEPVASQWISVNATLANIDDNSFKKDTVFSGKAPEIEGDKLGANRVNTFFSLFVLVPFVLVLPCVLCLVLFNGTAAAICFTLVALVVAAVALMPSDSVKKTLRTSYANDLVATFSHFFGFRLLLAGGIDTEKVSIFVSEFQDKHVYNSLVGSILHQLFHGFVAGIPLTLMIPASFLKLPVFGSLLDVLRCRGEACLDSELDKGQSVCVMSDKRSADISIPAPTYVRCALRYGAQLVPCYHEQRKDSAAAAGSLFFGMFQCASMTCYVGAPITCPLVENPSNELVFSYIEKVRGAVAELKSDLRKKQQP